METKYICQLASELASALGKFLRALLESALFILFGFETRDHRSRRVRAMQELLDEEHLARFGWTGSCRSYDSRISSSTI